MLIDLELHEIEMLRKPVHEAIMSQRDVQYTIWNILAKKLDEALNIDNE